jgi:hypothetical protein
MRECASERRPVWARREPGAVSVRAGDPYDNAMAGHDRFLEDRSHPASGVLEGARQPLDTSPQASGCCGRPAHHELTIGRPIPE